MRATLSQVSSEYDEADIAVLDEVLDPIATGDDVTAIDLLRECVFAKPAGARRFFDLGEVRKGVVVSITDHALDSGEDAAAIMRIVQFARMLTLLNPKCADRVVIGWWVDRDGRTYMDVGILAADLTEGLHVGAAFRQRCIVEIDSDRVREVAVTRRGSQT